MALTASERARARERIEGRRATATAMANRYLQASYRLTDAGYKRAARVMHAGAGPWVARASRARP